MAVDRELDSGYGKVDAEANAAFDSRDAAMGKGEEELFERKLTKEEKKAAAKAAREAKKKAKEQVKKGSTNGGKNGTTSKSDDDGDDDEEEKSNKTEPRSVKSELDMQQALEDALKGADLSPEKKHEAAMDWLSAQDIAVTYEQKKGKLHANTRDINVSGVSVNFHGKPLVEDTELVINYGNRYGFIGPNGSGKSTGTLWRGSLGEPRISSLLALTLSLLHPPSSSQQS